MYYENPDGVSVHNGFPNPATDTSLQSIDLNSMLIRHSASTFLMRIAGNEWAKQGIYEGDIAIVDRALSARGNDPVVWTRHSELVISPKHKIPEGAEVWGAITAIIHQYRSST